MSEETGQNFLKKTKYLRGRMPSHRLDWTRQPNTFKDYSLAERVRLPKPQTSDGPGIWEALQTRRSVRAYTGDAITLPVLSQLLWASQGITANVRGHQLRTAPSAGALYPVETYLSIHRVTDVSPGLYHYNVRNHELEVLKSGDFSREISNRSLGQDFMARAAVVFIWSAIFSRSAWKYLDRAYRYVFLDAGHIAENLALAAVSLGLGTCQVGAFFDEELNELLDLDGVTESVIYLTTVGSPRRTS